MTKSLRALLILSTTFLIAAFTTGCASVDKSEARSELSDENYTIDHCKFLGGLFKDKNLNDALAVVDPNGGDDSSTHAEAPKEKFTWPWDKGIEAKASRDRAKIRKAHRQQGCAD